MSDIRASVHYKHLSSRITRQEVDLLHRGDYTVCNEKVGSAACVRAVEDVNMLADLQCVGSCAVRYTTEDKAVGWMKNT